MKKNTMQFKKGAASFYIVAFATLILLVMATSFAAIIISELTRTQNDDLSQSAYDSALAGIEDAKLAFSNYRNCLRATPVEPTNSNVTCGNIVYWMETPNCDMVAHMLGRLDWNATGEVTINENETTENNMAQAYTCAKLDTSLSDYQGQLTKTTSTKIIKIELAGIDDYSRIKSAVVKWSLNGSGNTTNYSNFNTNKGVEFAPISEGVALPPTISVSMIQTSTEFDLSSFDMTEGGQTNRGTVYLVPYEEPGTIAEASRNYIEAYDSSKGKNIISASGVAKSNDKVSKNLPYAVRCSEEGAYLCSATIMLPEPVGGSRSGETFFFILSLPYGTPNTDFSLEFFCEEGDTCGDVDGSTDEGVVDENQAYFDGVQVEIDATGRANDLYRRVKTRLEFKPTDAEALLKIDPYAIRILGNDSGDGANLYKQLIVTTEYGL